MNSDHAILFESIEIGRSVIKNRFVMAPMGPAGMSDYKQAFNQRGIDYYVERAKGGIGLIITGTLTTESTVERRHPHMPDPTAHPEEFSMSARIMCERIHSYGALIFAQLTAGFGRVLIPFLLQQDAQLIGPSANPGRWIPEMITREMSKSEIVKIVKSIGKGAKICQESGFDGIQIHAVHEGYLLDQFATPLFNRRTDEYGGSIENRIRFTNEIVQEIKSLCGSDYPVIIRFSPKHFIKDLRKGAVPGEVFQEKGRDIEEGIEMALLLEDAGYDAIDIDVGSYDAWYWSHPPMYHADGLYLPYSEILKKHVSVPIITAGRMDDPDLASFAISSGKTDMIGLARPLLADPYLPRKIKEDRIDEIRPCLSCHEGCLKRMGTLVSCAVNPSSGHESEYRIERACLFKNVLVVGGGVSGCEAARVCALRGHKVTLYEKAPKLGGNLLPGSMPNFKMHDRKLITWYENQLKKNGVKIHYNTPATREIVEQVAPDTLIIATGSSPRVINIPGGGKVITATEALMGNAEIAETVLIIGGGLVGCETALWLVERGKKVSISEVLEDILFTGAPFIVDPNEQMLRDLLDFHKVKIFTNSSVSQIHGDSVVLMTGRVEHTVHAETIILAVGYYAETELYNELRNSSYETYQLGDSKRVNNIMNAIWESFEVARFI